MRRPVIQAVLFTSFLAAAAPAAAQVCVGSRSFDGAPVHLGLDLTLAEQTTGVHGALGFGGRVPFGGVAVVAARHDSQDEATKGLAFFGGLQLGSGRVSICPMVDLEFIDPPDLPGVTIKGTGVAGGARIGFAATDGAVRVVPTFGYFASRETTTLTVNSVDTSQSRTFGVLQFGVGFVGSRAGFGPVVIVPVGLEGAGTQLRLGLGLFF